MDYTPTTETVRASAESDDWGSGLMPGEFDRWLAEVKAQAWDEAGRDLHGDGYDGTEMYLRNPYRQG